MAADAAAAAAAAAPTAESAPGAAGASPATAAGAGAGEGGSGSSGVTSFDDIALLAAGKAPAGQLRAAPTGLGWRRARTGATQKIPAAQVVGGRWLPSSRTKYLLELDLQGGGPPVRLEGFRGADFDFFDALLKSPAYGVAEGLVAEALASKGWNWGHVKIDRDTKSVAFRAAAANADDGDERAFEIPLAHVSNATVHTGPQSRNDVTLTMALPDAAEGGGSAAGSDTEDLGDALAEIRLFIPNQNAGAGSGVPSTSKEFQKDILASLDVTAAAAGGTSMGTINDLQLLAPRGRHDVNLFKTFLKVHGKTHNFTIQYDNISRLYLLPLPDQLHAYVVLSLAKPVKRDRQQFEHLMFRFARDDNMTVTMSLEDEVRSAWSEIDGVQQGDAYLILPKILATVTGRKVIMPSEFRSSAHGARSTRASAGAGGADDDGAASAVKCSLKTSEGYLFPLQRSFFFVHKPATLLRFSDISEIEIQRYADGTQQSFDLLVMMENGDHHLFQQIPRPEYSGLFNYIRTKKIRIANIAELQAAPGRSSASARRGGDDEDMGTGAASGSVLDMFGDESSSDDDDFSADESSDVDEEYSSGSASDGEASVAPRKKKDSDDDDDESEDDDDDSKGGSAADKKARKKARKEKRRLKKEKKRAKKEKKAAAKRKRTEADREAAGGDAPLPGAKDEAGGDSAKRARKEEDADAGSAGGKEDEDEDMA